MSRFEMLALFKAISRLVEAGDLEGIRDVVDTVIEGSQTKPPKRKVSHDD